MFVKEGALEVRELQKGDAVLLAKWLSDPAVLEFYEGRDNPFDLEKVMEVFYQPDDGETRCIVEYEGKGIGYIQYYRLDAETKAVYGYEDGFIYGMDQFIGERSYWNRGIGAALVSSMAEYLVGVENADRVVMDPQAGNARALRCYEKCGFEKVRLLPKRELHEGGYRDCWLIEYRKA
ncbi:GNAT family N-acetyltransferase [Bacillus sp. FJAT-27245]|uniref:GNAT family N-acetyltransferase n=1 Tax=Bacillus sp. FJAT-27245 TaxID=1684144 RepID=UPI003FA44D8A